MAGSGQFVLEVSGEKVLFGTSTHRNQPWSKVFERLMFAVLTGAVGQENARGRS